MASEWPSREQVAVCLQHALLQLHDADAYLLQEDANERSITHRLAVYLEQEFTEWHVDCEYNRATGHGQRVKQLHFQYNDVPISPMDTDARSVFPDIIIHHRETELNLLVIEAKKSTSQESGDRDMAKLAAFTGELGYRIGLFVNFGCAGAVTTLRFVHANSDPTEVIQLAEAEELDAAIRRNLEVLGYGE